ncbi:glycosyltransferase [Oligoflexia bacterium]|nr:glycosyltransferase [Oligoflexia bacterium]
MKVLISRPDKIGDVTLALHGVKQLKRLRPQLEVYMHVANYTYDLVKNISFLDGTVRVGENLEAYQFDAVVDLMAKFRSAKMYYSASIPLRIGNSARWFRLLYNRTHYIRRSQALMNEAEYNWQLIRLVDKQLEHAPLEEALSLSDFNEVAEFNDFENYYVLMPGISASAVAWSNKAWCDLAKLLASDATKHVLILLGPSEQEVASKFEAIANATDNIHIKFSVDFKVLLGVLSKALAYVGPSTGITHLASTVGTSGVALYPIARPMHPNRWQPFHSTLKILSLADRHSADSVFHVLKELEGAKHSNVEQLQEKKIRISAFVICMDQERTIRRCLESIKWCDEVLVVDSGSTDATLEICREYNTRIIEKDWPGHREQKQFALEQCRGEWVLNIDSDEEVSPELKARILSIVSKPKTGQCDVNGYYLSRIVFFQDRWWDRGGWYPEYRMRLFRPAFTKWGGVNPHEKAITQGLTQKLSEPIYHYSWKDFTDLAHKFNKLSTNSAVAFFNNTLCPRRVGLFTLITHPALRFFKFYFVKRGYREGLVGFVVACSEAYYTLLKYAKLWELMHGPETGPKTGRAPEAGPDKLEEEQPPQKRSAYSSHQ